MKYIIDFAQTATDDEITGYLADINATVLTEWKNFEKIVVVDVEEKPKSTSFISEIIKDAATKVKPLSNLHYNETLGLESVAGLNDVTFATSGKQDWWKNYTLSSPELTEDTKTISRKGTTVPVYLMDSGIMKDHPEFADADIEDLFSITPGDFSDKNGHGTSLASAISGKTCGITDCPIKNVKIFEPGVTTYFSDLMSALDAIIENFQANTWAIVNCSWAIDNSPWIEAKMQTMISQGIMIFAAAGNSGTAIGDVTPAAMADAYTIGAYNENLVPCDFSDYTGTTATSLTQDHQNEGVMDMWAPGEDIYVATLDGSYSYTSGTSVATAIASSVYAYTLSNLVASDGTKSIGYSNVNSHTHPVSQTMSSASIDLLDIADPKYASSTKRVATILNRSAVNTGLYNKITNYITWTYGTHSAELGPKAINVYTVKEIEFINPLPDNFGISACGSLAGIPTPEQHPVGDELYRLITASFLITTTTGYTEVRDIEIYILNENFSSENLPDDHALTLALRAESCVGSPISCQGTGAPSGCLDNCGLNACCDILGKNGECKCGNEPG